MTKKVELLAPAGEPDAGYAALHYGADAIYAGLERFSARAEAVNFSLDDLREIVAYAHSLTPARRIYVTVNTVVLQKELAACVELLANVANLGVDGVIVQDLGVARVARKHFPELRLHASTQMAIHNLAGALTAKAIGFARVTLARELTLAEVKDITSKCGIETETFIHGALCYSYSGLCLFSSMMRGMSGNRGRCKYPCRDFCRAPAPLKDGFAFSMKDLALKDRAVALQKAGVGSFKIEGRMKNPLYVATVVNYYRRLLDCNLTREEADQLEAQMQTVFARPQTKLFLDSPLDQNVVDRDMVGHRGVPVGKVGSVRRRKDGTYALHFTTSRPLERHDGLQIDIPGALQPFGFPVDQLRIPEGAARREGKEVYEAPAGSGVIVALPPEHPAIPEGAPVYCSSSQAVKRSYHFERPKRGMFGVRRIMDVEVEVTPAVLAALARVRAGNAGEKDVEARVQIGGDFKPAKDADKTSAAARSAFEKLGGTGLALGTFACKNPGQLFVPVSLLNDLRRRGVKEIEGRLAEIRALRIQAIQQSVLHADLKAAAGSGGPQVKWSVKIDDPALVSSFEKDDWLNIEELAVDISRIGMPALDRGLKQIGGIVGPDRIRLALPVVTRSWQIEDLQKRIAYFRSVGFGRWQISNLSGWNLLGCDGKTGKTAGLNITADWPLYVLNRQSAQQLLSMGLAGFTLSPEDGRENMQALLAEFGEEATVVVYQDTPLFISASCAHANLKGGCDGKAKCGWGELSLKLEGGESVVAIRNGCGTVVVNERPFCLASRLNELGKMGTKHVRADFIWRHHEPEEVRDIWRQVRSGKAKGFVGNFDRGLA